jgi:hypothetical protein
MFDQHLQRRARRARRGDVARLVGRGAIFERKAREQRIDVSVLNWVCFEKSDRQFEGSGPRARAIADAASRRSITKRTQIVQWNACDVVHANAFMSSRKGDHRRVVPGGENAQRSMRDGCRNTLKVRGIGSDAEAGDRPFDQIRTPGDETMPARSGPVPTLNLAARVWAAERSGQGRFTARSETDEPAASASPRQRASARIAARELFHSARGARRCRCRGGRAGGNSGSALAAVRLSRRPDRRVRCRLL